MHIPFVDLHAQYESIKAEIDTAIENVIRDTAFIGGKYVRSFETAFANAYGVKHCVSVANGTDAIYITLKMLGIGAGDEVITVANSWISTSETITQAGARPVFADIDPVYYTIDPEQIKAKITSRTKAIIPVHLHGQMADIKAIQAICEKHDLYLIEDCAQSHFSSFNGQFAGTFGIASTFSFYPGKNLGAYGDAGCILTNDDALAEKCRMYANHGALKKHHHQMEGINSRLDGLQAAILEAKLQHIHDWTQNRITNASYYMAKLKGVDGIILPTVRPDTVHTFHVFAIRTKQRDSLQAYLKEQGIETAVHYPTALPLLPAYNYLGYTADTIPVAAQYQNELLSLPLYPELTPEQMDYVTEAVKEFSFADVTG
ncbi:DegT/DnrJ/EryC1/StrS family aminotransferase [Pontibacter cellulosilyticus]|uniref:DegT/DnrJ/EryC1/StrS family aminotransferase n=1 Tax=Pontibacter cellulosilyticus TaxID=1720253 RepID=A0A923N2E0_9BACT|nr:DegT/DnrJ/EryC1/StrS family aminotransferase [Pontibacter cellulosilyticus]MBC5991620.1 DegT/DnrJ/EryC1/StrS family aminotransferase [Pontibacter cellulosilyticus]